MINLPNSLLYGFVNIKQCFELLIAESSTQSCVSPSGPSGILGSDRKQNTA